MCVLFVIFTHSFSILTSTFVCLKICNPIIEQSNNIIIFLYIKISSRQKIQEMQGQHQQSQTCYFCNEKDIINCLTRSLYHKYNDSSNKIINAIDQLVCPNKQRPIILRKYEEIKHLIDTEQHISKLMSPIRSTSQMLDLLEYYKYRRFVPLFTRTLDNHHITESLHIYYYEKLKLYYNSIKKNLNITIQPSSMSDEDSFITKSDESFLQAKSKILEEFNFRVSKEGIKQFQSESKALQDMFNILKKHEESMKKIKTLRTEDCTSQPNPFKDNLQKKSNLISYLAPQTKLIMKKNHKVFFKYISQSKSQKIIEATVHKIRKVNKPTNQSSRNSLFYDSIKLRSKSESIYKLRNNNSQNKATKNERVNSKKKNSHQKSQKMNENVLSKQQIKALPKVQMQFNVRPTRSVSSMSLGHPYHQVNSNKLHSKVLPIKKEIDYMQIYQTTKVTDSATQRKKKVETKTPKKCGGVEIDQNDNLASINRKKIEQLKLRSQKKKQTRK